MAMDDESPEIDRLDWDDWNTEHIAKHGVTLSEVEEAIVGETVAQPTYKLRTALLPTSERRWETMTGERDESQGPTQSRIPDFQSREEEAEFWDTHDFTEFLDETQLVKLRVRKPLSEGLTVRLDRHDREELERRAAAQGIGPSTLVRMWIKDRLRQPAGQSATS